MIAAPNAEREPEYYSELRFFVWRQCARIIAFSLCMPEADALYAEYIGLDYSVTLTLHLYHYAVRDMTSWAMANGYKWFRSNGLNYDPKLHLRHLLDPIDLYVRHASPVANASWRAPMQHSGLASIPNSQAAVR